MDEDAKVKAMLDNLKKGREALRAKREAKKGVTKPDPPAVAVPVAEPIKPVPIQETTKPDRTAEKKQRWDTLHGRLDKIETLLNKPKQETIIEANTVVVPVKAKAKPKQKRIVYEEEDEAEEEPVVIKKKPPTQQQPQPRQEPQSQSDIIRRALLGNFY